MKSTRLQQIDGHFHGCHFTIKPTPISMGAKYEALSQMLFGWYKDNQQKAWEGLREEALKSFKEEEGYKDLSEQELGESVDRLLFEWLLDFADWKKDREFRGRFAKAIADTCMAFDKDPGQVWENDELEWSTIREAWDFFTGSRKLPTKTP